MLYSLFVAAILIIVVLVLVKNLLPEHFRLASIICFLLLLIWIVRLVLL